MDNTELALTLFAGIGFIISVIGALSGYRQLTLKKKAELKFIEQLRSHAHVATDIAALSEQAYADNIERECAIVGVLKSVLRTLPDEDRKQITGLQQPSIVGRLNYAKKLMTQTGIVIPNPSINLGLWLHNNFVNAKKADWLMLADIFGSAIPALRKMAVIRTKQINLGTDRVALVIELDESSETPEISVIMRMYPIGTQIHLPDNLKFTVIPESGEPYEYLAKNHDPAFETEWFFRRGEQFRVKVQLNDVTATESFVI